MSEFLEAALEYASMGLSVLPLRPKAKEPATRHGLKDASTDAKVIEKWWTENPNYNVGIACGVASGGLVVLDFDVDEGYDSREWLAEYESANGKLPETATVVTGREGTHLYYRCDDEIRPSVNGDIHVDVRGDGSYVMAPPSVHPNGNTVFWDLGLEYLADADEDVITLIKAVQPARHERKPVKPKDIKEGEGRNNMLYKVGCSMQGRGDDDELIEAYLESVNKLKCHPPVSERELGKIIASVLSKPKGNSEEVRAQRAETAAKTAKWNYLTESGRLRHNVFGRMLIEREHACMVDGAPAIWDGERYATGWDNIDRAMVRERDQLKQSEQKEIRHYIHLNAPRVSSSRPSLIAFRNCVVDMESGKPVPYTDDMVITNIIPHDFDANAKCKEVDNVLAGMACGDEATLLNLYEVIGLCMYRSSEFATCPVLLGSGSNGKSTYIKMIRAVLGKDNVSSLDLNVIGKPFQAGRLLGKLANLGDDISNEFLKGDTLAIFKKIVSGDWIYTDVKNGEGFEFMPFCTLVFSANEMPKLGDSSDGMMRRLFPIEFNAKFDRNNPDFDPRIVRKVTSEEACRRLCLLGLIGLQSVMTNNGLTPNGAGERMAEEIKEDNDTVLQWVRDDGIRESDIVHAIIADRFRDYTIWCAEAKVYAVGRTKFTRRVNSLFGTVSEPSRNTFDGKPKRVFEKCTGKA